jgi:UPF0755 protein
MKQRNIVIAVGFVVIAIAAVWGALLLEVRRAPEQGRGTVVRFEVKRGEPFVSVLDRLHGDGIVRSPRALRLWAAVRRADRSIKTGTYEFTIGESAARVLERLVHGDILRVAVTIPEGYMMWDIAGAFTAAGIDSSALLEEIQSPQRLERRHIDAPSLEGYLFPDTYVVPWGARAGDVVAQMLARLDAVFTDSLFARAVEIGMTPHEVLTLASIVEAEARVAQERPVISAVYHNRLRRGMRLEADPTVAYAMGGFRGRMLFAHLEIDSPYNTYRNKGLPPGPICSPGEAAIRAALYPDPDTDALYFVARGDGSHIFSRTLREHQAAVQQVRRARKRQSSP